MQLPELGVEGLGLVGGDAGGVEAASEEGRVREAEELGAGFGGGEGCWGDGRGAGLRMGG